MNELQRQTYMDAMGVDCYIPRLLLPGALPSQLCVMPDLHERTQHSGPQVVDEPLSLVSDQPSVSSSPSSAASSGRAAAMQAMLDGKPTVTVNKVADAATKLINKVKVSQQKIPHFSLSIIRGNNVLLIDEGMSGDVNSSEYLQLVQNLLFAVGAGNQQLSIDAFIWPMVRNSHIDQSETAARQTLEAFIAKQIEQLSTRYILVLGDTPAQYLNQENIPAGVFIQHPQLSAQIIRTQSVQPLLRNPALKREVWRDLQPLYRVLKKS